MPYLAISDFKHGMNRSRPQVAGAPGTLYVCKNAVISRGGDVVRAKKFASRYSLPSGTFGLGALKGQLFVFGDGTAPSGVPVGVQYQQLAAPNTPTMIRVLDVRAFDGKLYAIAEYDDGNIYHFYDGTRVSDWDARADSIASYESVATALAGKINAETAVKAEAFANVIRITAATAGTAFTVSSGATDNGSSSTPTATTATVQANVAAVAEVQATGTVTITAGSADSTANRVDQITVNGVNLLVSTVAWSLSHNATATALANEINNNTSTSGYSASAAGATVTISAAPGTGATPNGYVVAATTSGDVAATTTNMTGGVTAVTAVAQISTITISGASFDAEDLWTATVDGTTYKSTGRASGTGRSAYVAKGRVWSPALSVWFYCKLNDPADWSDATASIGSGFFNVSTEAEGAQELVAAATYQGRAAVFARDNIVIYTLDTDSDNISVFSTLEATGTMAARSPVAYGNNDVFYLDDTGVRSIRPRDGFDSAFVEDVGSAIDPFVQETMAAADADTLSRAVAAVERLDGRYFLAIGETIIVLSHFPQSRITAWSYLEPGFTVEHLVKSGRDLYARSGDTVYQYGGSAGDTYPDDDELPAVVETVFMDAGDPAGIKPLEGVDMATVNTWHAEILVDPDDTTKLVDAGYIDGTTYHKQQIKIPGRAALVALRLTCNTAGEASVSSVALHYERGETG